MSFKDIVLAKKEEILKIARSYGVIDISLMGSVADGRDHADSDVDLLVEFEEDRSLFDLVLLREELTKLLGRRIDIITKEALNKNAVNQVVESALRLQELE